MIMTKFEKVETGNNDMKIKRFSTAKIITGHGFDGFKVPVYWGGGRTAIYTLCQRRNLLIAIRSQRLNLEEAG